MTTLPPEHVLALPVALSTLRKGEDMFRRQGGHTRISRAQILAQSANDYH